MVKNQWKLHIFLFFFIELLYQTAIRKHTLSLTAKMMTMLVGGGN